MQSLLSAGSNEALNEVSSSLRTTLSHNLKDPDFSDLFEADAVKCHQGAEKMLPVNFVDSCSKDNFAVALR